MNKSLPKALCAALAVLTALAVGAATIGVAWDPSPAPSVTGYRVFWGTCSRVYDTNIDAGSATSLVLSNLADGTTYYLSPMGYAPDDASDFANEIIVTTPVVVTVSVTLLGATNLLGPWLPETNWTLSTTNPAGNKFYRTLLSIQ